MYYVILGLFLMLNRKIATPIVYCHHRVLPHSEQKIVILIIH